MDVAAGAVAGEGSNRAARRRIYVAATTAAGAAVLLAAAAQAPALPLGLLALFCAAAALSERFQVDSDASLDAAASPFSFSSGIHLAAVVVAGPWVAAASAAFGVVFVDRLRSSPWHRVCFNASVFVLATTAGAGAFVLAGGEFGRLDLPQDFLPFAAMAFTYAVVNDVLVAVVVALTTGTPILPAVRETCRSDWATDAAEAGLGALLAFIVLLEPWAVVLLVPLALAAYQAHARLAQMRRETARALETFANVVDERDPYTFRHSARVAEYVQGLAEALQLPQTPVARLCWAGRLHDLGKVAVDAAVLRRPGKLEDEEWVAMRRHPRLSARILRRFHLAGDQARAVEFHHERFDGRGYYGVGGRDLPLASHFLVAADSFDAMTSDRPYRDALAREHALGEISAGAGTQFHPLVARAFVAHQRGEDPLAVLSLAERAELARSFGRPRVSHRLRAVRVPRAEAVILTGGTGALAAVGLGVPLVAAAAAAVAATAAIWTRVAAVRERTLRRRVTQAAATAAGQAAAFDALAGALAAGTPLSWAGLVHWHEERLMGSLARQWNELGRGPTEAALTSWLVRESDVHAELLGADGADLGTDGEVVALPLRRNGEVTAFLALSFQRRMPRHVRALVTAFPSELQTGLAAGETEWPRLKAAS